MSSPQCAGRENRTRPRGSLNAQIRETHTGVVVLLGDRAYKGKKPVVTDFLDFSTTAHRERACQHELTLNRRLAPGSYLGVVHLSDPDGDPPEPVIVMLRHPDTARLAWLLTTGQPVRDHLIAIAGVLARFHSTAERGPVIDAQGTADAVWTRWRQNLRELEKKADDVIPGESVREIGRLVAQFIGGRRELFGRRIGERRIVDGHADLMADDIFCLPEGPALLDCLEFDDRLRYVDGVDDAAFLAMDVEFLAGRDLADFFLEQYLEVTGDQVPRSLVDFYIAYRAIVRAKVDCVRVEQGHPDAATDARRHIDMALAHLKVATVRLILVGGGPGAGKSTLSTALAGQIGAQVISTDIVRRELLDAGVVSGTPGQLDTGLYSPTNVTLVYDEVLRRAHALLCSGQSVILDGTWRRPEHRDRAHALARQASVPIVELNCSVPIAEASARVENRPSSNSDATPVIAAALAGNAHREAHEINTGQPLADSVREAQQICCLAI